MATRSKLAGVAAVCALLYVAVQPGPVSAAAGRSIVSSNSGFSADFTRRVAALGGTVERLHAGAGIAVVNGVSTAQLAAIKGVSDVQPDAVVSLDEPVAAAKKDAPFADPTVTSVGNPSAAVLFHWQWNMRDVNAPAAWAAGHLGSANVTAAILDTGIDYDSRDLAGLVDLSRSASFIPADDAITAALFPGRHVISDFHGHGTNVASQVSSKAGIFSGVTSKTTLIGVKVLDAHGSGSLSAILSGVLFAADQGRRRREHEPRRRLREGR